MNYENFCRVLTHIEQNPESWHQDSFYISCFAGIAATLAGCRSNDPVKRHDVALRYLDVPFSTRLFSCGRTLDDFRCVRLVLARTRLAQAAKNFLDGVCAA